MIGGINDILAGVERPGDWELSKFSRLMRENCISETEAPTSSSDEQESGEMTEHDSVLDTKFHQLMISIQEALPPASKRSNDSD